MIFDSNIAKNKTWDSLAESKRSKAARGNMKPIQSHNVASILRPECQIPGGERRVSLLRCPSLLYLGTSQVLLPTPRDESRWQGVTVGISAMAL